jgi:hypothetical protein
MGGRYSKVKKGYAADLQDGNFYCSGWERDFARFLNFLEEHKVIEGWQYEPYEFSFQGLGYARGPFTYKPDFILRFSQKIPRKKMTQVKAIFGDITPGELIYVEVKGQETGRDRNKWRRFRKHVGDPLTIVKRKEMMEIQERFPVRNWESHVY